MDDDATMAGIAGEWAVHWIRNTADAQREAHSHKERWLGPIDYTDKAYQSARRAAHYAFLADPNLRGNDR